MRYQRNAAVGVVGFGVLASVCGCSDRGADTSGPARYVTEQSFQENLGKQVSVVPQTLEQLRTYGVTGDSLLKLEFFFYARARERAEALAQALKQLGYEVTSGLSQHDRKAFVITGWTIPMRMDTETVVAWTEQMVRLGYEHDAEFDGWGTNPNQ